METNKKSEKEFHAVDYMRQIRGELTEQFFQDKQKYLAYLKKAMEDFKIQQNKTCA